MGQAQRLVDELGDRLGRFIVTTTPGDAEAVGRGLREQGALSAEPIAGQPLSVVEIGTTALPGLATDPRILCIHEDRPEAPGRWRRAMRDAPSSIRVDDPQGVQRDHLLFVGRNDPHLDRAVGR